MSIGIIAAHEADSAGPDFSNLMTTLAPTIWWRLGDAPYTITASTFIANEAPKHAFDGSTSTYWTTAAVATGWLKLQLATPATLTEYSIRRRDDIPNRNPKDWTFEGSNDGSSWTTLDTQTGITWGSAGETKNFTFSNSTSYEYYRLNVTANNGDSYLSVTELTSPGIPTNPTTTADSSGNSLDGTITGQLLNATGLIHDGDTDGARAFVATDGVSRTYNDGVAGNQPSFSVFIRHKPSSLSAISQLIHRRNVGGTTLGWTIRQDNAALTFYRFPNFSGNTMAFGNLTASTEYSVGLTYNASTGATVAYLNGSSVATATQAAIGFESEFGIGSSGTEGFIGDLDELAYWSGTVLSSTDMADLHTAAAAA